MSRSQTFALGDRVQPTSGPYRRKDFVVVGTKGDRIQVESANFRLAFPAKLLSIAPVARIRGASENELPPKTKTDEVITDEVGANPPTPELIQKVLGRMANSMRPDNSHIPINKNGHVLSVGDRVAGVWDKTITGIVEAIHPSGRVFVRYSKSVAIEFFESALILVPPEPEKLIFVSGGNPLEIAPLGCWIERKVHSGGWVEAVFKARTAIFPAVRGGGMAKSRYIGKWGSPAHSAAIEAVKRRNDLAKQKRWSSS